MPRYARKKSQIGIYHIMLRGINRQTIFEDDEDRQRMVETLRNYKTVSKFEIYCYCLLDNHIHLVIKEGKDPVSNVIKRISSSYVYWYNKKYERCGHLFQDRFKSEAIDDEAYLLTVMRYIHQNPVKAGISKSALDYKWSSYNEYLIEAATIDIDFALGLFCNNREQAVDLFVKYSNKSNDDVCLENNKNIRKSDNEVKTNINGLGHYDIRGIQQLESIKRNEIVKALKSIDGVSIRQLSRLTGISKSVIDRI